MAVPRGAQFGVQAPPFDSTRIGGARGRRRRRVSHRSRTKSRGADGKRSNRSRLLAVVDALPQQDRRCLYLRAEGLPYREIAGILDISLGAVSLSLARSLARIGRAAERCRLMNYDDSHPSDQQLLLDVEGELSSNEEKAIGLHLDAVLEMPRAPAGNRKCNCRFHPRPPAGTRW